MMGRLVSLICLLSTAALCNDGAGYVFELTTTDDWYYDIENMSEFEVRSFTFLSTFSCRLSMDYKERSLFLEERIKRLNEIGIALSTESNTNRLFEMILEEARHITHADGRTLYM